MSLRKGGLVLAAAGALFIALMTLEPRPQDTPLVAETPPSCLVCGRHGGVDVILNLILFMPLGAGLALAGLRPRRVLLAGLATTVLVEALQVWVVPGRDASLSDLLTNSTGAGLGAVIAVTWRRWLLPDSGTARRLLAGWAALWLGQAAITAWALHPAPPRDPWYGQHTAELGQFDQFRGTLLAATLGGAPMPGRRLEEASIAPLRAGAPLTLAVHATAGTATRRLAPIASVFDARQREVAVLGRQADGLIFRARMRTAALRLRTPGVLLPAAFAGLGPTDTITASGGLAAGRIAVTLTGPAGAPQREVALSPHLGWALLLPYDHPLGSEAPLLTSLWIAALVLPLGWWASRTGAPRTAVPSLLAVLAGGLLALPAGAGLPPSAWSAWAAAAAGAAAGWVLAARVRAR